VFHWNARRLRNKIESFCKRSHHYPLSNTFTFFKQLTIGYSENMYTKFDHKKENYYAIQENKENKINHNNIEDYIQI
jgi:hypothetical protein